MLHVASLLQHVVHYNNLNTNRAYVFDLYIYWLIRHVFWTECIGVQKICFNIFIRVLGWRLYIKKNKKNPQNPLPTSSHCALYGANICNWQWATEFRLYWSCFWGKQNWGQAQQWNQQIQVTSALRSDDWNHRGIWPVTKCKVLQSVCNAATCIISCISCLKDNVLNIEVFSRASISSVEALLAAMSLR